MIASLPRLDRTKKGQTFAGDYGNGSRPFMWARRPCSRLTSGDDKGARRSSSNPRDQREIWSVPT
ncbi:protein of unknown function [Agreia sp. COWG]|nr:protein of unknown function [Agreia sp. COWG]